MNREFYSKLDKASEIIDYELLARLLIENGMEYKRAQYFAKELKRDSEIFDCSTTTKEWALRRGFFPGKVELYGLNESNWNDYLSDFSYFMMHPLNNHFKFWVNDKLTLKYMLNTGSLAGTMPKYYLYVENDGCYTYLMDVPCEIQKNDQFILNLLKREGSLAIKPNNGSGGRGFMKVVWEKGAIYVNNASTTVEEFDEICANLQNNIVTEYVPQHKVLADFWQGSECTLRVIMIKSSPGEFSSVPEWHCIVSYARFGTPSSKGASNLSSGGIGVGFDFSTGEFNRTGLGYRRFFPNGIYRFTEHPATKKSWEHVVLPHWNEIRSGIKKVCDYLGSLDFFGFDVIVSQDGFKFCEINTLPSLDYEQCICSPILSDEKAKRFFIRKKLLQVKDEMLWDMYCKCRRIN